MGVYWYANLPSYSLLCSWKKTSDWLRRTVQPFSQLVYGRKNHNYLECHPRHSRRHRTLEICPLWQSKLAGWKMASNPVAKPSTRNGSGLSTAISLPKGNQSHPEACSKIEQILMIHVHVLGMLDDPPESENGPPATKRLRTETVVIMIHSIHSGKLIWSTTNKSLGWQRKNHARTKKWWWMVITCTDHD